MIKTEILKFEVLVLLLFSIAVVQAQQLTRRSMVEQAIAKSYDIRNQHDDHIDQYIARNNSRKTKDLLDLIFEQSQIINN